MKHYFYMCMGMLAFLMIIAEREGFDSLIDMLIWLWGIHVYFQVTISFLLGTLGILAIMLGFKVVRILKNMDSGHEN